MVYYAIDIGVLKEIVVFNVITIEEYSYWIILEPSCFFFFFFCTLKSIFIVFLKGFSAMELLHFFAPGSTPHFIGLGKMK